MKALSLFYVVVVFVFLYLPIVVLMTFSLNNTLYSGLWHGFTLHWYHVLFTDTNLQMIAWHSILVAILASTIATLIGVLAAVALFKYRFPVRRLNYALFAAMIIVPDLIVGVSLLLLFHLLRVPLGFFSLLIAHITFCLPFVFVIVYGKLMTLDQSVFEAARDLGAQDSQMFVSVMLPLLRPAVIASWLLCFTMSFDDVVISFFVSGPGFQILPLYIFSQVRMGVTPELNALCSIILLFTIVLAVVSQLFLRKRNG